MRFPMSNSNDETMKPTQPYVDTLPKPLEFPPGMSFTSQPYSADKIKIGRTEAQINSTSEQIFIEGKAPKAMQTGFNKLHAPQPRMPQKSIYNGRLVKNTVQETINRSQPMTDIKQKSYGIGSTKVGDNKIGYNTFKFKG